MIVKLKIEILQFLLFRALPKNGNGAIKNCKEYRKKNGHKDSEHTGF